MKILLIGLGAVLLYVLQRKIYEKWWAKELFISLQFKQESVFAKETCELFEVLENRKRLPLPVIKVKFRTSKYLEFQDSGTANTTDFYYRNDAFHIAGMEKITRTLTFVPAKRGYYQIRGIDLVGADLFWENEMVESRSTNTFLYVNPNPFYSEELMLSLRQINGEVLSRRHLIEDPFEYRGIREYQPYDDVRSINWKATARTDEIKVNQKNYTALKSIALYLDVEDSGVLKKQEAVEAAIEMIAALTKNFLKQGMETSLYTNGLDILEKTPLQVSSSAGAGQMDRIYRALARMDLDQGTAAFEKCFTQELLQKKTGLNLFVTVNFYDNLLELLKKYREHGKELIVLYPVWQMDEPALPEGLEDIIRVIHIRR